MQRSACLVVLLVVQHKQAVHEEFNQFIRSFTKLFGMKISRVRAFRQNSELASPPPSSRGGSGHHTHPWLLYAWALLARLPCRNAHVLLYSTWELHRHVPHSLGKPVTCLPKSVTLALKCGMANMDWACIADNYL